MKQVPRLFKWEPFQRKAVLALLNGRMHNVLPSRLSTDSEHYVEVEVPMLNVWQKIEVYLEMISVPLIVVGVVVFGLVLRFFKEIIIPMILALFLFQISKPIVLRLHRPIVPYFAFVEPEVKDEEKHLIEENGSTLVVALRYGSFCRNGDDWH